MDATAQFHGLTVAKDTEALLEQLLGAAPTDGEISRPAACSTPCAMPASTAASAFALSWSRPPRSLFDVPRDRALMVGAALECVHCYSLVHDDLPAMDDDDLRRGQPTAHKKYDEATAILAGDGLLTFAFDILARDEAHPDAAVRVELVLALARASGLGGMVGGQMLDLAAEGRFDNGSAQSLDEQGVATLQAMKTGALLRFGCVAGGILGQATRRQRAALERYGAIVGQAFQIADDLLDVEGDSAARQGGGQGCRGRQGDAGRGARHRQGQGAAQDAGGGRRGLAQAVRQPRRGAVRRANSSPSGTFDPTCIAKKRRGAVWAQHSEIGRACRPAATGRIEWTPIPASCRARLICALGLAVIGAIAIPGKYPARRAPDPNSAPNPYRMEASWAQLPAGR